MVPLIENLFGTAVGACIFAAMNELINLVVQKTGLSQDDAQKAVQVVVDSLMRKLPASIAAQVAAFLSGRASGAINTIEAEAGNILKSEMASMLGNL